MAICDEVKASSSSGDSSIHPSATSAKNLEKTLTTIIFDVDDTLYDVGTGFTLHRQVQGALSFMVAKLNFPDTDSAKDIWGEYFRKYHSTAKALKVAEEEGRFPPLPSDLFDGSSRGGDEMPNSTKRRFHAEDLAEWWATMLDFSLLGDPSDYADICDALTSCPLKLVAFSNGPRKYVLRVLREMGLDRCFPDEVVFAVDDVLPHCKPEKEAFEKIFNKLGVKAEECIMVEDSMKNIRIAKKLGMKTILVAGKGREVVNEDDRSKAYTADGHHTRRNAEEINRIMPNDAPTVQDPSVDACVQHCGQLRSALPGLWETPARFVVSWKMSFER